MIWKIVGSIAYIFGALLLTYLVTRIGNKFFKEKYKPRKAIKCSFATTAILILTISSCNKSYVYNSTAKGFGESFFLYMPCLLFWLLRDLRKEKAKEKLPLCPNCGKPGVYKDYLPDGSEVDWCPYCEQRIDT